MNDHATTDIALRPEPISTAPMPIQQGAGVGELDAALQFFIKLWSGPNGRPSMLPKSVKSPADAAIMVGYGARFGFAPMDSLYSVHVIEGRPSLRADVLVGLCKADPRCRYFQLIESNNTVATYETHRVGEPHPTRMSFTIEDAQRAGLAGKGNWSKYPGAMLRARASTSLARAVYPDVVGGVYYPGELTQDRGTVGVEGVPDGPVIDVRPEPQRQREPSRPAQTAGPTMTSGLQKAWAKIGDQAFRFYLLTSGKTKSLDDEAVNAWLTKTPDYAKESLGAAIFTRLKLIGEDGIKASVDGGLEALGDKGNKYLDKVPDDVDLDTDRDANLGLWLALAGELPQQDDNGPQ